MIHRDVKKALNLLGVQVHGQDAVGAGGDQQVGKTPTWSFIHAPATIPRRIPPPALCNLQLASR